MIHRVISKTSLNRFTCTLIFASALTAFCLDFAQVDLELRSVIANRQATDEDLLQAISRLGKVTEKAEFWQKIADDTSYTTVHRRRAIFALFRRHARSCTGIMQLVKVFGPSKWVQEAKVAKIVPPDGSIIVNNKSGESFFSISALDGPPIYISLLDDIAAPTLSKLLRAEPTDSRQRDGVILNFGFGDDYEKWLKEKLQPRRQNAQ